MFHISLDNEAIWALTRINLLGILLLEDYGQMSVLVGKPQWREHSLQCSLYYKDTHLCTVYHSKEIQYHLLQ